MHVQYLVIVTRLGVAYPPFISRARAALAGLLGAEDVFTYGHSCLDPSADSGQQARMQVVGGLAVPCVILAVALGLWALRWAVLVFVVALHDYATHPVTRKH